MRDGVRGKEKKKGRKEGGKVTRDWENNEEKKNCQKKRENKR